MPRAGMGFSTDEEFTGYAFPRWLPGSSADDFEALLQLYTSDPAAGWPYYTGEECVLAAAPRRGLWRLVLL